MHLHLPHDNEPTLVVTTLKTTNLPTLTQHTKHKGRSPINTLLTQCNINFHLLVLIVLIHQSILHLFHLHLLFLIPSLPGEDDLRTLTPCWNDAIPDLPEFSGSCKRPGVDIDGSFHSSLVFFLCFIASFLRTTNLSLASDLGLLPKRRALGCGASPLQIASHLKSRRDMFLCAPGKRKRVSSMPENQDTSQLHLTHAQSFSSATMRRALTHFREVANEEISQLTAVPKDIVCKDSF